MKHADVVLEGFDPATGATTWSTPVGDSPLLAVDTDKVARRQPSRMRVIQVEAGPRIIDMVTGELSEPENDFSYLCYQLETFRYQLETFRYQVKVDEEADPDLLWNGGRLARRCDAGGNRSQAPLSQRMLDQAPADFGRATVIAYPGRLVGYRASVSPGT